jgi:hypothetical protein
MTWVPEFPKFPRKRISSNQQSSKKSKSTPIPDVPAEAPTIPAPSTIGDERENELEDSEILGAYGGDDDDDNNNTEEPGVVAACRGRLLPLYLQNFFA